MQKQVEDYQLCIKRGNDGNLKKGFVFIEQNIQIRNVNDSSNVK